MKITIKEIIFAYLETREGEVLSAVEIADDCNLLPVQICRVMHYAIPLVTDEGIYKQGRNAWVYSPNTPVITEVSQLRQLHDILSEGRVSHEQIMKKLNLSKENVTKLLYRITHDYGEKIRTTKYYSIKKV